MSDGSKAGLPWRGTVMLAMLLAAVALIVHTARLAANGLDPAGKVVDLTSAALADPPSATVPAAAEVLRFAIAPVVSPESSLRTWQALIDHIGIAVGRPTRFMTRSSYAEVNELLHQRECDVALVCTYSYVCGQRDFGLVAMVTPVIRGAASYTSVVLAPAACSAGDLGGLRGVRFASSDQQSTSGWVWPALWLREHGHDPTLFFSEHVIAGSHDRSLLALRRGQVDAAAVISTVYEDMLAQDPAIAMELRVVQRSQTIGMPPIVCHPLLEAGLRGRIRDALLGLHLDARGRAVLQTVGIDRFETPEERLYDGVRAMAEAWRPR